MTTSIYSESPLLPEIIHYIATMSPTTWIQIAMAIPDFGRWSMTPVGRHEFAQRFIELRQLVVNGVRYVVTVYGAWIRSVYDWPAIIALKTGAPPELSSSDFTGNNISPHIDSMYWSTPITAASRLTRGVHIHRVGGPAVVRSSGAVEWRQRGNIHREDGPALTYPSGHCEWWIDGMLHRADGPAVTNPNGFEEWYFNGYHHRDDGPAVRIPGDRDQWYRHGMLHREDGPAVVFDNGSERWVLHGKLHRADGPAVVCVDGHREWFLNGMCHRTDGPAVIYPDGRLEWWENDSKIRTSY